MSAHSQTHMSSIRERQVESWYHEPSESSQEKRESWYRPKPKAISATVAPTSSPPSSPLLDKRAQWLNKLTMPYIKLKGEINNKMDPLATG